MLISLSIQNYALIDNLEIDFKKGFSTITGETGAGKSILLGAMGLLLGNRADSSVLRNKDAKCIVEGMFSIGAYKLKDLFKAEDVDYEEEMTIRRQISENGKSRAFVNDNPVNLNFLKLLGEKLIDIHSQHQSLLLSDQSFQLNTLDAFTDHSDKLETYKTVFRTYRKIQKELLSLVEQNAKLHQERDYFQYQYDELEMANLSLGEQDELEREQNELSHAEEIKSTLGLVYSAYYSENQSIIESIKDTHRNLESLSKIYAKVDELANRLSSSYYELKDIVEEIERLGEGIEVNPERLEVVNQRLDLIYTLQQKHKVGNIAELLALKTELANKLDGISVDEQRIKDLKLQLDELESELERLAVEIHEKRILASPKLSGELESLLNSLGMPHAKFEVTIEKLDKLTATGKDQVNFYFSANKNVQPQQLSKVASGGEISRVMLSLKYLLAKSIVLPTIIFDEIDTGVSGEIADKMGGLMKGLSKKIQVISITHLPQVASKGDNHYQVFKEEDQQTSTNIKLLDEDERVIQIAKMLSGEGISKAALENAVELLNK